MSDETLNETLGDRIRARRDARVARDNALTDALKAHIDEHFDKLHARLDELEKPARGTRK